MSVRARNSMLKNQIVSFLKNNRPKKYKSDDSITISLLKDDSMHVISVAQMASDDFFIRAIETVGSVLLEMHDKYDDKKIHSMWLNFPDFAKLFLREKYETYKLLFTGNGRDRVGFL